MGTQTKPMVDAMEALATQIVRSSHGHFSVETAADGTDWVQLDAQAVKKLTMFNLTGTAISVRAGGADGGVIDVPDGTVLPMEGLADADELEIKRTDESNTQVSVGFRWEA